MTQNLQDESVMSATHASPALPFPMSGPQGSRSFRRRTPRRRVPRRNRRGLIGMLLSIVVAVVIIIGIFAVYRQLSATVTATNTAIFVNQLIPQITSRYRGDYTGLNARSVIGAGFVPSNWQKDGSSIEDPEGRAVTITPVNGNNSFSLTFAGGVTEETCKAVLGALKKNRRFEQAQVVSVKVASAYDSTAEITAECQNNSANRFVLQFR